MLDSNGGGEFKPDEKRIFLSEIGQQSHRASSYESSIDIFPHDDHLLCEHHFEEMEHDSSYSNGGDDVNHHLNAISDVYKHTEAVSTTHSAVADHHHHHHQALLMDDEDYEMPKHNEIELVFQHVSHTIETAGGGGGESTRQILNDISGYASPGQVLAVMGPSGSGKTTLLNVLSGRTRPSYGHITLNNQKINKQLRRRICYVLQQDIFFPTLTLRQTLMVSWHSKFSIAHVAIFAIRNFESHFSPLLYSEGKRRWYCLEGNSHSFCNKITNGKDQRGRRRRLFSDLDMEMALMKRL